MPEFAYIARDTTGVKRTGKISAASQRDALQSLSVQALFPIEVKADAAAQTARTYSRRRVKPQLMATTYAQLAGLLRSGVPLLRALLVLRDQTSHAGLRSVLDKVHDQVEDGSTLADAMRRHPKAFGEMAINMVHAGGEGGFLEDALERVAEFTEKQQDLKSRTVGALAYPAFLAVVGTAVVIVLIVVFVPKFEGMFSALRDKGELPAMTSVLLSISAALNSWWGAFVLLLAVAVGILIRARLQTEDGRQARDFLLLRLPGIGPILRNLAVARFCRVLGTLLGNGVSILKALDISSAAAGNRVLAQAIRQAGENITAGESLAKPLGASGQFPSDVVEMISVAEESNTLEKVLGDISNSLERQTWRRLELFVRLLEPMMLLVLAAVVMAVVVALLIPILKMSMTV